MVAILSVGYLAASIANFLSEGANVGRYISFAGVNFPAVTANSLPFFAGLIISLFIIKSLLAILMTERMATKVAEIEARAAQKISMRIFGGSIEKTRTVSREELSFAIQTGTSSAFTGTLNSFASLFSEGFLFIILCISFALVNPLATLGMLSYFGALAYLIQLFVGKKLAKASTIVYKQTIEANKNLTDLSTAFRELAVAGKRESYFEKIYSSRKAASKNIGKQTYLSGMPRHIIETGLILGLGIFIFVQISFGGDIRNSVSTLGIFLAGGFRIVAAMLPWQHALVNIKINLPQSKSTWDLLEEVPDLQAPLTDIQSLPKDPLGLKVVNLSYKHQGSSSFAVSRVNIEVLPGQHVAIIGPSGAGKSTLVELLLGLAVPTEGQVFIHGIPANDFLTSFPGELSYVPQSPGLLSGSILENIVIGQDASEVNGLALSRALQGSHMDKVIDSMPDGIVTQIGYGRDSLSGGQKQRLGLARALYSNPKILVLDEATSALDAESEHLITDSLRKLKGSVTIITIAHRLNSIKDADAIYYLENGSITACGTLRELISSKPEVARAIELMSLNES